MSEATKTRESMLQDALSELETLRHEREGLQRELEQLQELQSRQARAPLARAQ